MAISSASCHPVRTSRSVMAGLALVVLASTAQAAPPLPAETIAAVNATLRQCTGWRYQGMFPATRIGGTELAPRAALLTQPSTALTDEQAEQVYEVAKSIVGLAPATRKVMADPSSPLTCPAAPDLGVALFEYLAGEAPGDLRGPSNTLDWLGLSYAQGVAGRDPARARLFHLRGKLHGSYMAQPRWSDGIDHDLLANAERAGLQAYAQALAADPRRGIAVRMALAERALPGDPAKARQLLRNLHDGSLTRLLNLEEAGQVPFVADAEDIAVWARAAQTLFRYERWAKRLLTGVRRVNGGAIPLSPARPTIASLQPHLDQARVAKSSPTVAPIPVRALVDPRGQPIYVEACMATIPAESVSFDGRTELLNAGRIYHAGEPARLPRMPVVLKGGKPVYGWVLLPAPHFKRAADGTMQVVFAPNSPEQCAYSAIIDMPPAPPPPPPPPPAPRRLTP